MDESTTTNPQPRTVPIEVELERRLAFLELSADDRRRLAQLVPLFAESAGEFVQSFYAHLLSFPDSARFLGDPALVARLKLSQQSHLESMLQADWDEEYVRRRWRVGEVHAQAGISPDIFLGAYMQYLKHLLEQLSSSQGPDVRSSLGIVLSLIKVVFLDIGLTLEAYFDQAMDNLRKTMDLVVQANSELRQFAHLTSHDLKTPLATVANLCDETLDEFRTEMPADAAQLIEAARNRIFRMSATIDELLTSTVRAPEESSDEEFSSQQLLGELLDQLHPLLRQKEIDVSLQSNLPSIVGDRPRIREAIYNVLANAVRFIDKKPGRLVIEAERTDHECIFTFADNGPGIPREDLQRVFMPFYRLRSTGERGAGLGLYFTKSLIERQGGRVWAESVAGQGSRFFIALPCSPGKPEER